MRALIVSLVESEEGALFDALKSGDIVYLAAKNVMGTSKMFDGTPKPWKVGRKSKNKGGETISLLPESGVKPSPMAQVKLWKRGDKVSASIGDMALMGARISRTMSECEHFIEVTEASAEMEHYMGRWDRQMGRTLSISVLRQTFDRKFAAPHKAPVQTKVSMGGRIKKFTIPGPRRDEVGLRIRYIGKPKPGAKQAEELIAYVIFDGGPESDDSEGPGSPEWGTAGDTASVFITHEMWSPAEKARTSRLVFSSVNTDLPQVSAVERTIEARLGGWSS